MTCGSQISLVLLDLRADLATGHLELVPILVIMDLDGFLDKQELLKFLKYFEGQEL